jgi:signal peptidase I
LTLFTTIGLVVLLFVLSRWLIPPYRVSGGSMRPALVGTEAEDPRVTGDVVLVNHLAYILDGPARWDVVMLAPSEENDTATAQNEANRSGARVKRVVGLPGETVEIRGGELLVNGIPLQLPARTGSPYVVSKGHYGHHPVSLQEDEYFLLGDNSYLSSDSRQRGPVRRGNVQGKVVVVVYPWGRFGVAP